MSRARLLDRIVDLATSVLIRALHDEPVLLECRLPLLGVVVAWPSPINRWTKLPTGRTLSDDSWRNIDRNGNPAVGLDRLIADRFKIEPSRGHALNDANAVAIAAAFDRCRRRSEHGDGRLGGAIIALRIGGGLGAGTVIVGRSIQGRPRSPFLSARLLEGAGGYAGELGHWQVPQQDLDEFSARARRSW